MKEKPRCIICNDEADRAHIKSRGSGGNDEWDNILFLCRAHHVRQHWLGWRRMCEKFPQVDEALRSRGWSFNQWGKLIKTQGETA